uniref:Uncharacterized protein n=1 Tax=Heterorhabditis bacteriophora TaxID=37862 RepID=A0A1I7X1L4_HETBA
MIGATTPSVHHLENTFCHTRPQLKKTACCGHKLDELVFPKDSPWDLGPVSETASP